MAVIVKTNQPELLANRLMESIKNNEIPTWSIDDDGDITIANIKWTNKAWFQIKIEYENNILAFGIISSKIYRMTNELYGVYHGRLAATLLAYFDSLLDNIELSSGYDLQYDVVPL